MAAYFVIDLTLSDPAVMQSYSAQVTDVVHRFGGKFLVRGGACEPIEGGWAPQVLGVIEFADTAAFHRFHDSPDYAPLMALRQTGSVARAVCAQGVPAG